MAVKAGHGALAAVTLDPGTTPGIFTTIPELFVQIDWGWEHETSANTPHNRKVDTHTVSPVITRPERTLTLNFDHEDSTHLALQDFSLPPLTKIGMRFTAPDETPGSSVDEIVESGYIRSWQIRHPMGAESRKVDLIWRPSGPFLIDGTLYS